MSDSERADIIKPVAPNGVAHDDAETDEAVLRRLAWFQDQKFGFFMHWGAYCQWGCIESWPLVEADTWARPDGLGCWEERGRDLERFRRDYRALNRSFNPIRFDPASWADAAHHAGMRYAVFTTKHHDGFCMFDTRQTDYRITAPDCPFSGTGVDVTRAVFDAFRARAFGIGAYYSKSDWHHADYWDPTRPTPDRNPNYDTAREPAKWARFAEFVYRQIEELVSGYGPVDILWLDGGQVRPPNQDIKMDRIAAMARSHQRGLIIADRTVGGRHENYLTPEQEVPDQPLAHPWESCVTMGSGWSYRPDDDYKPARELIRLLVDVVAKGGNLLLNVGPSPAGELPRDALARLREIGEWMAVNGEAIHGTRAVPPYRTGDWAFTRRGPTLYAIYLPPADLAVLPRCLDLPQFRPSPGTELRLLGADVAPSWRPTDSGLRLDLPPAEVSVTSHPHALVFSLRPENGV